MEKAYNLMNEKLCPSIDGVNLAQKYYRARVMVFVYKRKHQTHDEQISI